MPYRNSTVQKKHACTLFVISLRRKTRHSLLRHTSRRKDNQRLYRHVDEQFESHNSILCSSSTSCLTNPWYTFTNFKLFNFHISQMAAYSIDSDTLKTNHSSPLKDPGFAPEAEGEGGGSHFS